MNRRDLLKLGSLLVGGLSASMLTGCNSGLKKVGEIVEPSAENVQQTGQSLSITPKQTAMYEYSSPMPLNKKVIDELYRFNKKLKKGKITTFYSCVPSPLADKIHPYFSLRTRGLNRNIKSVKDFTDIAKYAMKKGFKVIYTINSPKAIMDNELYEFEQALKELVNELREAGINDFKITNPLILEIMSRRFPDINLHLSTTSEYHSVQVYDYALREFRNIKSINISTDDNHNFDLLYSLRKLFPSVKLELLVNEHMCVKYCISRHFHPCTNLAGFKCKDYIIANPQLHLSRNNLIHPWELEYYSAIGVNNFKFVALPYERANIPKIDYFTDYLECVENGLDKYSANDLIEKIYKETNHFVRMKFDDKYTLKELAKELPDINYFVQNGARCFSDCGSACRYCYDIADNLKKITTHT